MVDFRGRCIARGLGQQADRCFRTSEACTGLLEFRNETKTLERTRDYRSFAKFENICDRFVEQISFGSIRQQQHCGLYQHARGPESKPNKHNYKHMDVYCPTSNRSKVETFKLEQELCRRPTFSSFEQIRVDVKSSTLSISRQGMGPTHMRQVRIPPDNTVHKIQLSSCSHLTRYKTFCIQSHGEFPPQTSVREASITGFLLNVSEGSKRPLSITKMAWAAITHLYDALGEDVRTKDITHFMQALVKHGTSCPQGRTSIPPI
ncbi:hypothetical protein ElyMa_006809500 [Elysia marginata]|uniref:Uncharacterized protein n=1 Tax=Elysia marginata TaxID=1093978 RepID=A0AAV4J2D4_9GAST|nr:hypothetical protein ElyMa_006809500 [Elysia marginata]